MYSIILEPAKNGFSVRSVDNCCLFSCRSGETMQETLQDALLFLRSLADGQLEKEKEKSDE